jgi:hypothetical protein
MKHRFIYILGVIVSLSCFCTVLYIIGVLFK